ncbi:MAG: recombinase-like helix-turn-helix domain-containing protein [Beijerinckiaceae bacterium]
MQEPYLQPHQTRDREPTDYENLLADALEKAFAGGADQLDEICRQLIADCVPSPGGQAWTATLLQSELKRLGA